MNLSEKKQALRSILRAKRKALSPATRQSATVKIAEHLLELSQNWAHHVIAGYCAMGSEADVTPLLARLQEAGHRLALPAISEDGLLFRSYLINDPLQKGPLNTHEPFPTQALCQPDVVLVPLLGFDDRLMRLGQGAGFYDQTLEKLRRTGPVLAIGIAFSCQRSDAPIPSEPHDQPLDFVITEQKVYAAPLEGHTKN